MNSFEVFFWNFYVWINKYNEISVSVYFSMFYLLQWNEMQLQIENNTMLLHATQQLVSTLPHVNGFVMDRSIYYMYLLCWKQCLEMLAMNATKLNYKKIYIKLKIINQKNYNFKIQKKNNNKL